MFSPIMETASLVWTPAAHMMVTLSKNALSVLLESTLVAMERSCRAWCRYAYEYRCTTLA